MASSSSSRLRTLLKRRGSSVAILDGGMGTALAAHGLTEQQCWTAAEALDDEQIRSAVRSVYEEYLEAGADILTINTYNISAQKYCECRCCGILIATSISLAWAK